MQNRTRLASRPVAKAVAWGRVAPEPYSPMPSSPAARAGLLGLRVLLGLITAMAGYAFAHGLMR